MSMTPDVRAVVDWFTVNAKVSGSDVAFDPETGVMDISGCFRPEELAAALAQSGEREAIVTWLRKVEKKFGGGTGHKDAIDMAAFCIARGDHLSTEG